VQLKASAMLSLVLRWYIKRTGGQAKQENGELRLRLCKPSQVSWYQPLFLTCLLYTSDAADE